MLILMVGLKTCVAHLYLSACGPMGRRREAVTLTILMRVPYLDDSDEGLQLVDVELEVHPVRQPHTRRLH